MIERKPDAAKISQHLAKKAMEEMGLDEKSYWEISAIRSPNYFSIILFHPDKKVDIQKEMTKYLDTLYKKVSQYSMAYCHFPSILGYYFKKTYGDDTCIMLELFLTGDVVEGETKIDTNTTLFQLICETWIAQTANGEIFISKYVKETTHDEDDGPKYRTVRHINYIGCYGDVHNSLGDIIRSMLQFRYKEITPDDITVYKNDNPIVKRLKALKN